MVKIVAGIDIGYDTTKVVAKINGNIIQKTFKSIAGVGKPFLFNNGEEPLDYVVNVDGREYTVGEEAAKFKLPIVTIRNKNSIKSSAYRALLKMAIKQITSASNARIFCVTGLPVSYYYEDRKILKEIFMQEKVFEDVAVIPQPMGSYLYYAIDQNGIQNYKFFQANVVIVDIGRYTTDVAVIVGGDYINELSGSITVGVDLMIKMLHKKLIERFPNITDESILQAIKTGNLSYYGKFYPIQNEISKAEEKVSKDIESYALSLIEGEVNIQRVIVTGGGANIFKTINFNRLNVTKTLNPVMTNAFGYMHYALFRKGITSVAERSA